ncbi:DUF4834 domain-containing protein [Fulvivirgaceae bacterium BMA10]|uniref:DUF4834 domain-containing protein n=1 Tax=Splendidivirga corallicola TaxID=3051826 RepID=A0ABT8KN34_9BACT|nr:DUF4834 domain-containing protein [Fulvivirgaceae bacterium BMA10]
MLRIAIIVLSVFLIFRFLGRMLKAFSPQDPRMNRNAHSKDRRRPSDGNVDVDYVPPQKKESEDFKGGDYIDYEEIK